MAQKYIIRAYLAPKRNAITPSCTLCSKDAVHEVLFDEVAPAGCTVLKRYCDECLGDIFASVDLLPPYEVKPIYKTKDGLVQQQHYYHYCSDCQEPARYVVSFDLWGSTVFQTYCEGCLPWPTS